MKALLRAIGEASGLWPDKKRNTVDVQRAIFAPAATTTIINVTSERMLERINGPVCAMTIAALRPIEAAQHVQMALRRSGIASYVDTDAEPGFPRGFLVFLLVPSLKGIAVVFYAERPSADLLSRVPPAEPWSERDLLS